MTENKSSSRNFRRKYPGSPEQFYSLNRSASGSQVVKEIPARGPVWRKINRHPGIFGENIRYLLSSFTHSIEVFQIARRLRRYRLGAGMTGNKVSSRNFRRKYPGSPEQFYSLNNNVSGSQGVKKIPARRPVWRNNTIRYFLNSFTQLTEVFV